MRLKLLLTVDICFILLMCKPALSKYDSSGINKVLNFPSSFFNNVNQTIIKREALLAEQTEHTRNNSPGARKKSHCKWPTGIKEKGI
jgi:hypothetical protein